MWELDKALMVLWLGGQWMVGTPLRGGSDGSLLLVGWRLTCLLDIEVMDGYSFGGFRRVVVVTGVFHSNASPTPQVQHPSRYLHRRGAPRRTRLPRLGMISLARTGVGTTVCTS